MADPGASRRSMSSLRLLYKRQLPHSYHAQTPLHCTASIYSTKYTSNYDPQYSVLFAEVAVRHSTASVTSVNRAVVLRSKTWHPAETIHVTLSTEFRHHFSSLRAKHDPTNPLLLYKSHQNDYILDSRGHELLISGVKISEHFEEKERQRYGPL